MRITIVALDDCMASAVVGLRDAFAMATGLAEHIGKARIEPYEVEVASPGGCDIAAFGGYALAADRALADARATDAVIVPPIMQGIEQAVDAHPEVTAYLREASATDTLLASVCTGAFFLAEAGVLDGRVATTSHFMATAFRQRFPHIELEPTRRLIAEPTVVCAGATTAYLHLAIHLIERTAGHAFAVFVSKHLIVDTNTSPQAPYFLLHPMKQHGDADVRALQDWIEAHYRDDITAEALADRGAMSQRSLTRRFRAATGESPGAYVRRVRIEVAKRLLESESLTIDQITDRVGYVDQRSFARLFKQTTGVSPGEYRRRFGR